MPISLKSILITIPKLHHNYRSQFRSRNQSAACVSSSQETQDTRKLEQHVNGDGTNKSAFNAAVAVVAAMAQHQNSCPDFAQSNEATRNNRGIENDQFNRDRSNNKQVLSTHPQNFPQQTSNDRLKKQITNVMNAKTITGSRINENNLLYR